LQTLLVGDSLDANRKVEALATYDLKCDLAMSKVIINEP
jgi:hypothetical protein